MTSRPVSCFSVTQKFGQQFVRITSNSVTANRSKTNFPNKFKVPGLVTASSYAAARSWAPFAFVSSSTSLKIVKCPSNPKVHVPGGLFDGSSYVAAARSWALHATNFYRKNGITAECSQGSRKMMAMDAKGWCSLFQNPKRWRAGWRIYMWSTSTSYGRLTSLIFLSMESWPSTGRESWGHDQAVPQSLWSSWASSDARCSASSESFVSPLWWRLLSVDLSPVCSDWPFLCQAAASNKEGGHQIESVTMI